MGEVPVRVEVLPEYIFGDEALMVPAEKEGGFTNTVAVPLYFTV
jgi:hypothetical protein